jgi:hypothetical protein
VEDPLALEVISGRVSPESVIAVTVDEDGASLRFENRSPPSPAGGI